MLAQRAASEGPRWTRAVEDPSAPIPEEVASGLGRMGREAPGALFCSQNAHDKNVLVRCAQLRATLATPLKTGEESSKGYAQRAASKVWRKGCAREKSGLFEHPAATLT